MKVVVSLCLIFSLSIHGFPAPSSEESQFRSKSDFALPSEEINAKDDIASIPKETKDEESSWLSRIVPELEFPDLLKPVQIQIPLFQFPELPSYSIQFA